jgi:hypothetical protein
MRFILNITLGILLFGACGNVNTSDEGKLYADYMVRYLSEGKQLSVKAKFKKVKTGVSEEAFLPKEGVFFGDKYMVFKSMQGVTADYYSYEQSPATLPDKLSFQFTDDKKQAIQHNLDFSPMQNLKIRETNIQLDSGFAFVWEGDTISVGQELTIIIEQDGKTPIKMNKVGSSPYKSLFIRKEQLVGLQSGKATASVVQKKYQRYPKESEVGGSYIIEYYHPKIQMAID